MTELKKAAKRAAAKRYYIKNRESIIRKSAERARMHPEKYRAYSVKSYYKHREKRIQTAKAWQKANKARVAKRQIEYARKRRAENPILRLSRSCRNRVRAAIKESGRTKTQKTQAMIGCSFLELKKYIESLFLAGMSWDNYGYLGWHIDHIIPIACAKNETELMKLFHFTNLRPMWANENWKKGKQYVNAA